jgi:hypothetical protein
MYRDHEGFGRLLSVTERMRQKCYAICTLLNLSFSLAVASRSIECVWHFGVFECETPAHIKHRKFKTATRTDRGVSSN